MNELPNVCKNTDIHLWKKDPENHFSPSVHATENGGIGINVGGHVIVMSVEKWHELGCLRVALTDVLRP